MCNVRLFKEPMDSTTLDKTSFGINSGNHSSHRTSIMRHHRNCSKRTSTRHATLCECFNRREQTMYANRTYPESRSGWLAVIYTLCFWFTSACARSIATKISMSPSSK